MHIPLRLTVSLLLSVALIACSQSTAPSADDQEVAEITLSKTSVNVPYVINSAEVAGAATIVTSAQVKPVDPSGIGTVEGYLSTEERGVLLSTLRNSDQEVIALDVLVGDVKQTLSFNAENSAKAQVMFTLGLFDVPYVWMVEAYGQIESHDLFPQLVQLHRDAQRYADTDESAELSVAIAIDIKADLLVRDEQMSGGSLEAQRILKDFSGDQSIWIEEHPDTPGKFTVHANSALDQRIFVYETSALDGASPNLSYLANNGSVTTNAGSESYVARPGTFPGGFRNIFERTSATFTLSDPGCKVYTVAASALAYGPGGSFLDTESNPNYENFANAAYSFLSLMGLSVSGNEKASEAVLRAHATFSSIEIGYSEGENLANALRTAEVFTDAVSEALNAILQVQTRETWGENVAEIVLAQDAADVAKRVVRRVLTVQEGFYVGAFISSLVQESLGDIPTALISTGGPEFQMELNDTSLTGTVGEVLTGSFTLKNTGCRAMEYEATAKPSTFPTELGAPGGGTVEAGAEVQQNFEVTCDHVATGTAKFQVVGYDPVAKVDIAAVNPVVGVECVDPAPDISEPTPGSIELVAKHAEMAEGSVTVKNEGSGILRVKARGRGFFELLPKVYYTDLAEGESLEIQFKVKCSFYRGIGVKDLTLYISSNDPDEQSKSVDVKLTCYNIGEQNLGRFTLSSWGPYHHEDEGYWTCYTKLQYNSNEGQQGSYSPIHQASSSEACRQAAIAWNIDYANSLTANLPKDFEATHPGATVHDVWYEDKFYTTFFSGYPDIRALVERWPVVDE